MEPACGSVTPLGDSTRVIRTVLYNHAHGNHKALKEGGRNLTASSFCTISHEKTRCTSTTIPIIKFHMPTRTAAECYAYYTKLPDCVACLRINQYTRYGVMYPPLSVNVQDVLY